MIAEFYIIADSFAQNASSTVPKIEEKIRSLATDIEYIHRYKETNKIYVHPEIYEVDFINGVTISDLLFNMEISARNLDRDARVSLQGIISKSAKITDLTSEEVKEVLLPAHDENICHGLIAFNLVQGINPLFQIIYNLRGWLEFRRYFLGLYPRNADFFVDECKKYFPEIYFHERIKTTINGLLSDFPKKIIFHLAALNDKFRDSQQQGMNRSQVLQAFSAAAELDATASLEGNAARKADFVFDFLDDDEQMQPVCCEPHLKLCRNDKHPGDTSYSFNRIYFHEGLENIQQKKLLIGHIGSHL